MPKPFQISIVRMLAAVSLLGIAAAQFVGVIHHQSNSTPEMLVKIFTTGAAFGGAVGLVMKRPLLYGLLGGFLIFPILLALGWA